MSTFARCAHWLGFLGYAPRPTPRRFVLLKAADGGLKVVEAKQTQAGWLARYYENLDDQWALLGPKGTIKSGPRYVTGWEPHSGWSFGEDLLNA